VWKRRYYLVGRIEFLHQSIQKHEKDTKALESSNDVVTNRVLKLRMTLRVLFGYLDHDRVGDDVASASHDIEVGLAEEVDQRI
jgi:hypothetical protein